MGILHLHVIHILDCLQRTKQTKISIRGKQFETSVNESKGVNQSTDITILAE